MEGVISVIVSLLKASVLEKERLLLVHILPFISQSTLRRWRASLRPSSLSIHQEEPVLLIDLAS